MILGERVHLVQNIGKFYIKLGYRSHLWGWVMGTGSKQNYWKLQSFLKGSHLRCIFSTERVLLRQICTSLLIGLLSGFDWYQCCKVKRFPVSYCLQKTWLKESKHTRQFSINHNKITEYSCTNITLHGMHSYVCVNMCTLSISAVC